MHRHRRLFHIFYRFSPRVASMFAGLGLSCFLTAGLMAPSVALASDTVNDVTPSAITSSDVSSEVSVHSRLFIRERSLSTPAPTAPVVTVVRPMMADDLSSTALKPVSSTNYRGRSLLRERR